MLNKTQQKIGDLLLRELDRCRKELAVAESSKKGDWDNFKTRPIEGEIIEIKRQLALLSSPFIGTLKMTSMGPLGRYQDIVKTPSGEYAFVYSYPNIPKEVNEMATQTLTSKEMEIYRDLLPA